MHGRESVGGVRDATSNSISKLLFSNSLGEFDYSEQQLQAESRNFSMLDTISCLEVEAEQPQKLPRLVADHLKDLPVLKEVVLKDITNDAMESFKSVYAPNGVDEEVNSGWQLFLQEHQEHADALA